MIKIKMPEINLAGQSVYNARACTHMYSPEVHAYNAGRYTHSYYINFYNIILKHSSIMLLKNITIMKWNEEWLRLRDSMIEITLYSSIPYADQVAPKTVVRSRDDQLLPSRFTNAEARYISWCQYVCVDATNDSCDNNKIKLSQFKTHPT